MNAAAISPQKFRSRPVVIEAMLYVSTNAQVIIAWAAAHGVQIGLANEPAAFGVRTMLEIPTLEGMMRCARGSYVIRGTKDEFYPCKGDIFEGKYDAVEKAASPAPPEFSPAYLDGTASREEED